MNINELKAEIARHELTIPKLADMIQMSKKTLYSRVKGETSFTQQEISLIMLLKTHTVIRKKPPEEQSCLQPRQKKTEEH